MPITHPVELARLAHVRASLDLVGDPDYDYIAHPHSGAREASRYFAEWDFEIPARGVGYFDDIPLDSPAE